MTLPLSYSRQYQNSDCLPTATGPARRPSGAGGGIRTPDPLITNQMLYQLSYASPDRLFIVAKTREIRVPRAEQAQGMTTDSRFQYKAPQVYRQRRFPRRLLPWVLAGFADSQAVERMNTGCYGDASAGGVLVMRTATCSKLSRPSQ